MPKYSSGSAGATLLLLLLQAGAAPVSAQLPMSRSVRFGFGGGVSVPVSDAGEALKNGVNGQGFVLVNAGGIPLRFNLGYQKFDFDDAILGGATGETSMVSGVVGISFDLVRLGPLTPYVTAGLGAFNLMEEFSTGGMGDSTSDLRFGIDGGAGLRLQLGRLEAFAEARVQNVYTEAGAIDAKTIRAVPVTFGILF